MLGFCEHAEAECAPVPGAVQEYLHSNSGWSLVTVNDLVERDKFLWEKFHRGLCPGFAIVKLDGFSQDSYALALLKRSDDAVMEKAVLLTRRSGKFSAQELSPPRNIKYTDIPSPLVVWRAAPGRYQDLSSDKAINISSDSVIYEKMEAAATAYYLAHGRILSIVTSE